MRDNQIVPAAHKAPKKHRRKHRRVRDDWSGCKCPEGTEYRSTPRITRGWTCLKKTARGPRFVRAMCDITNKKLLPPPKEYKLLPENTLVGVRSKSKASSSASKKRRALQSPNKKLLGAACGCPEGASRVKTKNGSRCHKNGKFVKTVCVTGD